MQAHIPQDPCWLICWILAVVALWSNQSYRKPRMTRPGLATQRMPNDHYKAESWQFKNRITRPPELQIAFEMMGRQLPLSQAKRQLSTSSQMPSSVVFLRSDLLQNSVALIFNYLYLIHMQ